MVYAIFCRYEHRTSTGKEFTEYFLTDNLFNSEDDVKNRIKELKELSNPIDKSTKLKHEYKYDYVDETLLDQPRMRRPKGRPKKFSEDELKNIVKVLNKKGIVKIDNNIKEFLYNDDDAKKYISDHIKDNSKWTRYWYDNDYNLFIILKDK